MFSSLGGTLTQGDWVWILDLVLSPGFFRSARKPTGPRKGVQRSTPPAAKAEGVFLLPSASIAEELHRQFSYRCISVENTVLPPAYVVRHKTIRILLGGQIEYNLLLLPAFFLAPDVVAMGAGSLGHGDILLENHPPLEITHLEDMAMV